MSDKLLVTCPWCDVGPVDYDCITDDDNRLPGAGDIGICGDCFKPYRFTGVGTENVKITDAEMALLKTADANQHEQIEDSIQRAQYMRQVYDMNVRVKGWLLEHPDVEVLIEFPRYNGVVITTVTNALERGYIRANEAGRELIQYAMGDFKGKRGEPTLLMMQMAIEGPEGHAYEQD